MRRWVCTFAKKISSHSHNLLNRAAALPSIRPAYGSKLFWIRIFQNKSGIYYPQCLMGMNLNNIGPTHNYRISQNRYKNIISKVHLFLKQCCTILGWLNFMFLFNITSTDFRLTSADSILKRTIILIQLTLRCQINKSTRLAFLDFCPTLLVYLALLVLIFHPTRLANFPLYSFTWSYSYQIYVST